MSRFPFKSSLIIAACAAALALPAHAQQTPANTPAGTTAPAYVPQPEDFIEPISQYKMYVLAEIDELVDKTRQFTAAIKAGQIEQAKAIYAPARLHYERIEPAAELFGDMDPAIDAREDDYKEGVNDPEFTGFHHLEYLLFSKNTTQGADKLADRLMADVLELQRRLQDEPIPVVKMVQGAADLMDEIAQTKISGEEDRYSRTDLWDFSGNLEGSIKIVELLRPLIVKANPQLLAKIERNFAEAQATLNKYRTADGTGFQNYTKVTDADKVLMQAQITTLAEDLSTLRATLGLDN